MIAFINPYWLCLLDKLPAIFTIIIWPTVYFRDFAWPVTMTGSYGCCPLQRVGTPWILCSNPSSFENRIEEIKHKQQLHGKHNHGNYGNKPV